MKRLQELYEIHQQLTIPDTAHQEELDEQIFMVIDLETMVLAYTEALLTNVDPKFVLDTENLDRMYQNIARFSDLSSEDHTIQVQLLSALDSLRNIRDHHAELS